MRNPFRWADEKPRTLGDGILRSRFSISYEICIRIHGYLLAWIRMQWRLMCADL